MPRPKHLQKHGEEGVDIAEAYMDNLKTFAASNQYSLFVLGSNSSEDRAVSDLRSIEWDELGNFLDT